MDTFFRTEFVFKLMSLWRRQL